MLAYDPTISAGNLIAAGAILFTGLGALVRQIYNAAKYAEDLKSLHRDFNALRTDLGEIKGTLNEQDRTYRAKLAADSLADGLMLVLQQRVLTLEQEYARYRETVMHLQLEFAAFTSGQLSEGAAKG